MWVYFLVSPLLAPPPQRRHPHPPPDTPGLRPRPPAVMQNHQVEKNKTLRKGQKFNPKFTDQVNDTNQREINETKNSFDNLVCFSYMFSAAGFRCYGLFFLMRPGELTARVHKDFVCHCLDETELKLNAGLK